MKNKIKDYIDLIFADAPDCKETRDLKAEMYNNVCDRFDDLVKEGMSEASAYNKSISGIGDVSELIEEIRRENSSKGSADASVDKEEINLDDVPKARNRREFTPKEQEEIQKYRVRRGLLNSIAIALYILCWIPLVVLAEYAGEAGGTIGIVVMMIMVAAATGMMIMKSSMKPLCLRGVKDIDVDDDDDEDEDDDDDDEEDNRKKRSRKKRAKRYQNPVLKSIKSAVGIIMVVAYFVISFASGAWHITWVIFLINAAFDNILDAIFELSGKKYEKRG